MSVLERHDIALEIDGVAYLGWTSIMVARGIDTAVGEFDLELAAREATQAEEWPITDGAACRITLGGRVLITGWIDAVERFIGPETRGVAVRGRDKAGDLVDCSAVHSPGSWRGQRLETIAAELAAPFDITIRIEGDTGPVLRKFALQQGETVFAAIERMARSRGLAIWSTGDGALIIGKPDSGQRTGRIEQGINLIEARGIRDVSQRYSVIHAKGQAAGDDTTNGAAAAQAKGSARDAEVRRHRPLLVVGEEQSDSASLTARAQWEAAVRAGRGRPASLTVPGWFADDGTPWEPGARAWCNVPACHLAGDMLVERVELLRDAQGGTVARLNVVPPEAWTLLAEREAEA